MVQVDCWNHMSISGERYNQFLSKLTARNYFWNMVGRKAFGIDCWEDFSVAWELDIALRGLSYQIASCDYIVRIALCKLHERLNSTMEIPLLWIGLWNGQRSYLWDWGAPTTSYRYRGEGIDRLKKDKVDSEVAILIVGKPVWTSHSNCKLKGKCLLPKTI